jgi:hypothetical protein
MALILNGTDGLSDVDGSAATPAIRGTDANTGIFFPAADTIAFSEGGAEAMRIDSSGNVGIGTSSPSQKLNVSGSGSVYSAITNTGTGPSNLLLGAANAQTQIISRDATTGAVPTVFLQGTTESMRIDSNGNLLVGTTGQRGTSVISTGTLGVGIGSGTAVQGYRQIYFDGATGILFFSNGVNQSSLTLAGAWTNASDARLKNSITDIKYGLETVLATQPRSYKMNDLEGDYIGFVAQELQTVIPEVVSGNAETQLGVDYGSLVAVAFKAIQELNADLAATKLLLTQVSNTVDAQAVRIAALEAAV